MTKGRGASWNQKTRLNERKVNSLDEKEFQTLVDSGEGLKIMKAFMSILTQRFQRAIRREGIGVEGDLEDTLTGRAYKNPGALKGQSKFNFYGRMVDMGVGKGVKLYEARSGVALTESRKNNRPRRRAKKWYGPTLTQQHQRLAAIMAKAQAGELVAATAARLRREIEIHL